MAKYSYKAKDDNGKTVTGTVEADDEKSARGELSSKDLHIMEIKEDSGKTSFFSLSIGGDPSKKKVKVNDVIVFTRQLATMIHAGLPLLDGLNIMIKQVQNPGFKAVLMQIGDDVKGGSKFSDSLRKHPKVFNETYVSMVEAGEEGGVLDEILHRILQIMEKNQNTKTKIKSAFTYPIIIVFISVFVVGFLTTFVFPKFIKLFLKNNVELPLPTALLFNLSNFVRGNWYILVAVFIIGIIGLKKYRGTPQGRKVTDGIILKMPLIGDLTTKVVLSRFARTLATLYSSGVQILTALEIVKKSIGNRVITSWMDKVQEGVKKGESLAKPMAEYGNFPPMLVQMVATGEQTGAVTEMLTEIANAYDVEVDYSIQTVTAAIEPLLIVFMGVVVGFTALALFLPMFDMMNVIKK